MVCENCIHSDLNVGPCDNKDCTNHPPPSPRDQHRYEGYDVICLSCQEKPDHYNHKNTKCMRSYCWEERCNTSCLCREHTEEVLRGEAKAPPLRTVPDYVGTARKTFLIGYLPEDTMQTYQKPLSLTERLSKLVRDFKDKL